MSQTMRRRRMVVLSGIIGVLAYVAAPGGAQGSASITLRQLWTGPDTPWTWAPSPAGTSLAIAKAPEGLATYDLTRRTRTGLLGENREPGFVLGLAWAPSPHIAYTWQVKDAMEPGMPEGFALAVRSMMTGELRTLSTNLPQFSRPRFSPDGNRVIGHAVPMRGVLPSLYTIDLATGTTEVLLKEDGAPLLNPSWSRDGRYVFYERAQNSVWRLDPTTGTTKKIVELQSPLHTSAPAPDGRSVAMTHGSTLSLTAVETGVTRELVRLPEGEQFAEGAGALAWSPDGRRVVFVKHLSNGREVWQARVAEGTAEPIGVSVRDRDIYFLRMNRDGSRLAFASGNYLFTRPDVWMVEHLF